MSCSRTYRYLSPALAEERDRELALNGCAAAITPRIVELASEHLDRAAGTGLISVEQARSARTLLGSARSPGEVSTAMADLGVADDRWRLDVVSARLDVIDEAVVAMPADQVVVDELDRVTALVDVLVDHDHASAVALPELSSLDATLDELERTVDDRLASIASRELVIGEVVRILGELDFTVDMIDPESHAAITAATLDGRTATIHVNAPGGTTVPDPSDASGAARDPGYDLDVTFTDPGSMVDPDDGAAGDICDAAVTDAVEFHRRIDESPIVTAGRVWTDRRPIRAYPRASTSDRAVPPVEDESTRQSATVRSAARRARLRGQPGRFRRV